MKTEAYHMPKLLYQEGNCFKIHIVYGPEYYACKCIGNGCPSGLNHIENCSTLTHWVCLTANDVIVMILSPQIKLLLWGTCLHETNVNVALNDSKTYLIWLAFGDIYFLLD